ncbi:MAG: hypothetical protein KatS3mg079_316 [Caloramator sp.]|nr:MAG: hypothetical protein KatS3mg079_316 [Caloramator sp.]
MNYKFEEKLIRYIDAGFPIIYIQTFEESKVDEIIKKISGRRRVFEWNLFNGFVDAKTGKIIMDNSSLENTLNLLKRDEELEGKLLVLKDINSKLNDSEIVAVLKGIANKIYNGLDSTIIIVSYTLNIPKELEKYITILELDNLSIQDIKEVILNFLEVNDIPHISDKLLEEMAIAFRGLSEFEIINILSLAYADDGDLSKADLSLIFDQKQQMIKKAGILEMIPLKETIDDIGGLENLKDWLKNKALIFKNIIKAQEFGVDMPKGVLIAGVPGCGKSLNAKAAAKLFEVPLLRLDVGRLMGKYVGESEENLRRAIALSEAIAPCILWIDELEKAFAGIGNNGSGSEVTTRLFGNLLTWMQEKESAVFVVATANDIMKLPPELLRKGRFDEIFYVGLPNKDERKKIFEIHISKRRKSDLEKIDLDKIVQETEGYSGADIEGVVKESVEIAFINGEKSLTTEIILSVIKKTHSLSEIMKDSIEKMSSEYEKRKFKKASK